MNRRLDIDPGGTRLYLRFSYNEQLKNRVRALPGTRFDWEERSWYVPLVGASALLPSLIAEGFVGDRHVLEQIGDAEASAPASAAHAALSMPEGSEGGPELWSVSTLNSSVKLALEQRFPQPIWLVGSVEDFRPRGPSGHLYFSIVERSDDGSVLAQINVVLFRNRRAVVEQKLSSAGVGLENDLLVCMRGQVTLYASRGNFQFVIEDVDPRFSLGELERRREEILRELRSEGLDRLNLGHPLPLLPLRVALLTSAGSEAEADFLATLRESALPFVVTRFDVRVQGREMEESVASALAHIHADPTCDAVVITRGGGSRVELSSWDNLAIARAVARLPVPVLVAIGHENDRCVLDEIARSLKTPTEAAHELVNHVLEAEYQAEQSASRIAALSSVKLQRIRDDFRSLVRRTGISVELSLRQQRQRLDRELPRAFERALRRRRERAESALTVLASRARRALPAQTARAQSRLDTFARRLERASGSSLRAAEALIERRAEALRLADPSRILKRGFAIVRSGGVILRSVDDLKGGELLEVELAAGSLRARVEPDGASSSDVLRSDSESKSDTTEEEER